MVSRRPYGILGVRRIPPAAIDRGRSSCPRSSSRSNSACKSAIDGGSSVRSRGKLSVCVSKSKSRDAIGRTKCTPLRSVARPNKSDCPNSCFPKRSFSAGFSFERFKCGACLRRADNVNACCEKRRPFRELDRPVPRTAKGRVEIDLRGLFFAKQFSTVKPSSSENATDRVQNSMLWLSWQSFKRTVARTE